MVSISASRHKCTLTILCAAAFFLSSRAQQADSLRSNSFHQRSFSIVSPDTIIQLPHQFIIQGTETVLLDSVVLDRGRDYVLDSRSGTVTFKPGTIKRFFSDGGRKLLLVVRYQAFPFEFKKGYQRRAPVSRTDTLTGGRIAIVKPASKFSIDDLFGANLQKSGSIVRGFTLGSNQDLSLNSGFRMQMSGKIADDVEILAALTDENSPIQPEGTTQTLQEVDKVFVQLRSSDVGATLGDFNMSLAGNEFGGISRKLQGAEGRANYRFGDVGGDVLVSGAATRGKYTSNQFQGIDGVQGPYRLTGSNSERAIIVIAGTERVYVNGEEMRRGEINDYTIDYANGEVTFASRKLITAASRITVDFEYTDRRFTRSLVAVKSTTRLLNDRAVFSATFVRERDDENSAIGVTLSDSDKAVLREAGNSQWRATRSGIEYVGPGKGQYIKADTIIVTSFSRDSLSFYRFAPQDTLNAVYTVTFSYVGMGNGDYNKVSLGQYQFVGVKRGSYAPLRFLPMPQSHTLTDIDLTAQASEHLRLTGEYAITNLDANLLSPKNDGENVGSAFKFGLQFAPRDIHISRANIGSIDINVKERIVNRRFAPIDRTNEVEFNRKWNITDSMKVDEELREANLVYYPVRSLTLGGGLGWIKRGESFSSNRYEVSLHLFADSLPKVDYELEVIKNRNDLTALLASWTRHRANAEYRFGSLTPSLRYEGEILRNRSSLADTLQVGSLRYNELTPGVAVREVANMSLRAEWGWRWDDSVRNGSLVRASRAFLQRYGWQLEEWKSLSSSLDLTLSRRQYSPAFSMSGNKDVETILLRSQTRLNPWNRGIESDWFYEVATERSAKLERFFQRVPKGTGNYAYVGDLNGNHIADESDFAPARFDGEYIVITLPSDELVPVVNLKASSRVRFNVSRLLSSSSWLGKTLSALSTETYFRVEEKNSDPDLRQIYLLHFSRFLNDRTTIAGSNLITQDVYLFENRSDISLRLRLSQRRGLAQYALQTERTFYSERSVRARWQLIEEVANQVDFSHTNDNLLASQYSSREREIVSDALSFDWSYRPEKYLELGFRVGVGQASNSGKSKANLDDQSVRLTYSLEERGQVKVELLREEVTVENSGLLPFELTGGKVPGKTWRWQMSMDYKVSKFIQASASYDGRLEGFSSPVHTARAEVRAFF